VLAASITLIALMEAASTSETSVNFYQTTRRNNPEDNHINFLQTFVRNVFLEVNTGSLNACGHCNGPSCRGFEEKEITHTLTVTSVETYRCERTLKSLWPWSRLPRLRQLCTTGLVGWDMRTIGLRNIISVAVLNMKVLLWLEPKALRPTKEQEEEVVGAPFCARLSYIWFHEGPTF
jgi:hypothetical protein